MFILSVLVLLTGIYFSFGKRTRNRLFKLITGTCKVPFKIVFFLLTLAFKK
jgi:hypothetical protein